jgi:hypothetical protein
VLGLREGATENAAVVSELLGDLAARGLDFGVPRLYVLDGGKDIEEVRFHRRKIHGHETSKRAKARTMLRLADLEQSKNAVLHSLGAASSQESYGHAIDEFIGWYCSEPRLAFNRTVVLRYRFFLEQKNLAPSSWLP